MILLRLIRYLLVGGYGLYLLGQIGAPRDPDSLLILGAFYSLLALTFLVEQVLVALHWNREMRALRSWDPGDQAAFLDRMRLRGMQAEYRQHLEDHLGHESDGAVERFPFAEADRKAATRTFWLLAPVAGVSALAAAGVFGLSAGMRWLCFGAAAAAVVSMGWLIRRLRRLATVLEVTRFGVREVHPNGLRRFVSFDQALVIRNRPDRKRVELAPPGSRECIALDYDRVAVVRAYNLVVERGGFRTEVPE